MIPQRRVVVLTGTAMLLGQHGGARAQAENYPTRPIRIIVPFATGGGSDIAARLIGAELQTRLGQPVIVDNRPGASGVIGTAAVAKAAPDGYTLTMGSGGTTTINPQMMKVGYDPIADLAPVGLVAANVLALVVPPSLPAKSMKELVTLLRANPGKFSYSSPGTGTPHQLAMELFKKRTGSFVVHVPYKGSGQAIADLLAGHVHLAFETISAVMPHIKAGRLRALATSGRERSDQLPDVPTVAESGLAGFEAFSWYGLLAPAGTPKLVIDKLNAAMRAALDSSEVRSKLDAMGATAMRGRSSEDMRTFMRDETAKWGKLITDLKLQPD